MYQCVKNRFHTPSREAAKVQQSNRTGWTIAPNHEANAGSTHAKCSNINHFMQQIDSHTDDALPSLALTGAQPRIGH